MLKKLEHVDETRAFTKILKEFQKAVNAERIEIKLL